MFYRQPNDCRDYKCSKLTQIMININPYCMSNRDIFVAYIVNNYLKFLITFCVILFIFTICQARAFGYKFCKQKIKGNRIDKRNSRSIMFEDITSREIIFISLQGKNTHLNPWYLDLDTSSDFKSFVKKRDHFTLTRVYFWLLFFRKLTGLPLGAEELP